MSATTEEEQRKVTYDYSQMSIHSLVRTKTFHPDLDKAINKHIALELFSWYSFEKLMAETSTSDVALHGFAKFFCRSANEALADALFLRKYLLQRGGMPEFNPIPAPKVTWPQKPVEPHEPIHACLELEKDIYEDAIKLLDVAQQHHDYGTQNMIEDRILKKETRHIKDLGDLLKAVNRVSKVPGHGLYHIDKDLRECDGMMPWCNEATKVQKEYKDLAMT
ncbi:hypothetical protein HK104_001231 [Borealophlyctis nickersoniae]|nr:hypothetical protein HK104_001231 [Borealophlyctis nickersoniae]